MIHIEQGALLNFEQVLNRSTKTEAKATANESRTIEKTGRLSSCNVRLSFGDVDPRAAPRERRAGQQQPMQESRRSGQQNQPLSRLSRYDKLLVNELFCYQELKKTSRTLQQEDESRSRLTFGPGNVLESSPDVKHRVRRGSAANGDSDHDNDEFVVYRDNFLVYGHGLDPKYQLTKEVHTKESPIVDVTWCVFQHHPRQVKPEHAAITPVMEPHPAFDALCIAEKRKVHVHQRTGEHHSHASSFPIHRVFSTPLCLLIERDTNAASNLTSVSGYPSVFSMTNPVDELSPVLFLGDAQNQEIRLLLHPDSSVVGTVDELPLVLIFEPDKNIHSLWMIRFTTAEEIEKAAEIPMKGDKEGEHLQFHGNCESPRMRNQSKSASALSARTVNSTNQSNSIVTPPLRALLPGESARKHSLHREVLLASGRKFSFPESASSWTPHSFAPGTGKFSSPLPVMNFSQSSPEPSGSSLTQAQHDSRKTATLSSNLTTSDMSISLTKNSSSAMQMSSVRDSVRSSHSASPNVPASALKDIRSTTSMFPHSKILNNKTFNSEGQHTFFHSPTQRQLRSGSLHSMQSGLSSKRFARTVHPGHPVLPITDELAFPKIAMVHVWNDSVVAFRQKPIQDSFLFVDCFEHTYFCFVSLAQHVLKCVQLKKKTGDHAEDLLADGVVTLPAISAVSLRRLNVMAVLHPSKELRVYASPALMLYVVNVSSPSMSNIGDATPDNGPTTSSPQVTKFVRQFWSPRFSPVQMVNNTPTNTHSATTEINSLAACNGNKLITKTSNGSSLLRFPHRPSSDVIELCLIALRTHSDSEFFGRLFVELSKNHCSIDRRSLSLQDRWDFFFKTLFSILGCSVSSSSADNRFSRGSEWDLLKSESSSSVNSFTIVIDNRNFTQGRAEAVLFTLHLVYEETQLCEIWRREQRCMSSWMSAFAEVCGLSNWKTHYENEMHGNRRRVVVSTGTTNETTRLPSEPLSIVKFLESTLSNFTNTKFPVARLTNPISKKLILLTRLLTKTSVGNRMAKVQQFLEDEKLSVEDVRLLPQTLQVAIRSAFGALCEHEPFDKVSTLFYEIAGRRDAVRCKKTVEDDNVHNVSLVEISRKVLPKITDVVEVPEVKKKSTVLSNSLITKRFAVDARVREAERLLTTSEPIPIPLNPMHFVNEVEFRKAQEGWLKSVAPRTMSLPVARGMLSLRSEFAYATEKLTAPDMLYTGVERATGRKITLKNEDLPTGHDFWPRFHNGVATGLRLCHYDQDCIKFDYHWLAFNTTTQQTKRETVEYAGMFLGMALNGLIDVNTDPVELHNLLVRLEDSVSIAVILGMACVKRGTQDKRYFRMIGLHIISFVPDSGIELVIPPSIHVASLLSLGLLYMGSANRFVSERLLVEIWSGNVYADAEGNSREGSAERESASLAAAVGLGFVLLGMGNESGLGIADLKIPQRLRTFMTGGMHGKSTNPVRRADPTLTGVLAPARTKERDEQLINTHITAPGAILALAMIYMKTERADIAEWMEMPKTLQELDETRPDFLMLRVVARSLIMWNTVETSDKWVNSNFPTWITKTVFLHTSDLEKMGHDVISLTQAYFYILAGAGLALGFRYAGTADECARQQLTNIADMLSRWTDDPTVYRRSSQGLIQTCLTNVLLALSMVMAGTGDLHVLRLLRFMHGRPRMSITYGHQMGVHIAIGLLFLGCGMHTLGTSNEAIAALLIAFFPMWPKGPSDNRYHLQAFRHLYVLAVENRLAMTRSAFGGKSLQSTIKLTYNCDVFVEFWKEELMTTPCVLPEFCQLKEISFASGTQWIIFQKGDHDWVELKTILQKGGVTVYPSAIYHSKKDLRLDEEGESGQAKDLIRFFGQYISRPADKAANILADMSKFSKTYETMCADRGLACIFQMAKRTWSSDKVSDNWIAWLIYENAAQEQPEALLEVLAFSIENEARYANVADLILRLVFQGSSSTNVWKKRLRKENFSKMYNLLFLKNNV